MQFTNVQPRSACCSRPRPFVDVIGGRHVALDVDSLLSSRQLIWSRDWGWTWDAWPEKTAHHAFLLSGSNSRFSLPALASKATTAAVQQLGGVLAAMRQGITTLRIQAARPGRSQGASS
ncbi:predicted protein [Haematococcus lacustris]|uniref:Uncharacterized protein n=1 Tax=Haematococcus lacustris TaxID=44745 RepID=A0A699ZNR8_HAELA|nr:predicted protein [Haematococcus lacustris]